MEWALVDDGPELGGMSEFGGVLLGFDTGVGLCEWSRLIVLPYGWLV